jgi:hypothetical protein
MTITDLDDVIYTLEPPKIDTLVDNTKAKWGSIESVIVDVKEKFGSDGITSSNINLLIKYVLETVERFPKTGCDRKNMAINIINQLVDELPETSETDMIKEMITNGLISNIIDLIVGASKGELSINIVEDVATTCIPSCFKYIQSKIAKRKLANSKTQVSK